MKYINLFLLLFLSLSSAYSQQTYEIGSGELIIDFRQNTQLGFELSEFHYENGSSRYVGTVQQVIEALGFHDLVVRLSRKTLYKKSKNTFRNFWAIYNLKFQGITPDQFDEYRDQILHAMADAGGCDLFFSEKKTKGWFVKVVDEEKFKESRIRMDYDREVTKSAYSSSEGNYQGINESQILFEEIHRHFFKGYLEQDDLLFLGMFSIQLTAKTPEEAAMILLDQYGIALENSLPDKKKITFVKK